MLITIEEFRARVVGDVRGLVANLQEITGRYGEEEATAWGRSLPRLSTALNATSLQSLHLYFGNRGNLALEYQLPGASSWCDVVMLGRHDGRPAAVIVELKDWMTRGDKPGRALGLIERQGRQELHPSDQVRGYAEYCRRFHSTVLERDAAVHGCVLFTNDRWIGAYKQAPNDGLAIEYPMFADTAPGFSTDFPAYFAGRLTDVDRDFAESFAEGRYRQDRGFVAQIGAQLLDPAGSPFELLDNQRRAFAIAKDAVDSAVMSAGDHTPSKRVIIVLGPPGSGKSAIAARLWASLVSDSSLPEGDVVFTTTSASQNTNWEEMFGRVGGRGAAGIVKKASGYTPVTTGRVGQLRKRFGESFLEDAGKWREHLATIVRIGEPFKDGARTDQHLVSIVDEAHALINPEHNEGRGQFGFAAQLGPQAYHIIRSSIVSVFLLDPKQGFRARENTTVEDITHWAAELGAGAPEIVDLGDSQFRCAGSREYVEWVESLLGGEVSARTHILADRWRNVDAPHRLDFRVFGDPEDWESALRDRAGDGATVRLLASYCRPWKTREAAQPHQLPEDLQDFHERYMKGAKARYWTRPWNFAPNGDYSWFVQASPGSYIAEDPLCEVGCPYVVRGFDYDYIGLLWLDDLLWRDGWEVDPGKVEETGFMQVIKAARREAREGRRGRATGELLERVAQTYRILMTRPIRGIYLWVPDEQTRQHIVRAARSDQPA